MVWRKINNQPAFRILTLVLAFFITSWPVLTYFTLSLSAMLLSITLIWLCLILLLFALVK